MHVAPELAASSGAEYCRGDAASGFPGDVALRSGGRAAGAGSREPPRPVVGCGGHSGDGDYDDVVLAVTGMTAAPHDTPDAVPSPSPCVVGVTRPRPRIVHPAPLASFPTRAPPTV